MDEDGNAKPKRTQFPLTNPREGLYGGKLTTGRPPGVLNKKTRMAQQILREKQEELVGKLLKLTEPVREGEFCPLCGAGAPRDENVIVRAIAEGMDRGGTPRVTQVETLEKPDVAWMEYLTDEQIETLGRWIDEARERMPINEPPEETDEESIH